MYNRLYISREERRGTLSFLTLYISRETSWKKEDFQPLKVVLIFLKIQPFLCFQIHQHEMITISKKQGPLKDFLAVIRVEIVSPGFHGI
jgi:hypothetical protein